MISNNDQISPWGDYGVTVDLSGQLTTAIIPEDLRNFLKLRIFPIIKRSKLALVSWFFTLFKIKKMFGEW